LLQFAKAHSKKSFGITKQLQPIYIPLRRLSADNSTIVSDLLDKKTQIISEEILQEYPKGYFDKKLERGECIVLFDGLDEVISEAMHRIIAERINSFVTRYKQNRFIITCRIAGWRNLLPDFTALEANDLSREEIHRFIRGWHTAVIGLQERNRIEQEYLDIETRVAKSKENASKIKLAIDDQSRRLLTAIEGNARILSVATNPMLLSLICLVHLNRNILPRGRALLYGQCVEFLVDAWDRSRGVLVSQSQIELAQKELILRQIAYELQISGKGELSRTDIEALVGRVAAKNAIAVPAKDLLEDIERRSGLLVERSIDVLGFSHLTLQEYLVAKHIQMNPVLLSTLSTHLDDREWREVVLLYAGLIDDASELVRRIIKLTTPERLLLAGHTVGEAQRTEPEASSLVVDRLLTTLTQKALPQDVEATISALAAVSADFRTEAPVTVEQMLSATLIEWLGSNDDRRAIAAIEILGRARIVKALPLLVDLMLNAEALTDACIGSIILFGNLALEPIDTAARSQVTKTVPVDRFLKPLVGISTGSSALSIIRLYNVYDDERSHLRISSALSSMFNHPLIVSELLQSSENDVGSLQTKQVLTTELLGDRAIDASPAFIKLYNKMVSDLSEVISRADSESTERLSMAAFQVMFPALVTAIRNSERAVPESTFSSLGFDIARLNGIGTTTENICRMLKKEDPQFSLLSKRVRRGSVLMPKSVATNWTQDAWRAAIDVVLCLLYFANVAASVYFIWDGNVPGEIFMLLLISAGLYPISRVTSSLSCF
jgi:hypothetical protein